MEAVNYIGSLITFEEFESPKGWMRINEMDSETDRF